MRSYQYNCLKKSLQQRGEIAAFITTIGLVALTATLLIANSLVKSRNAIRTSAQSVPTVTIVNPAHLSFINPGSYTIKWTTSGTNFFPDSGMLIMDDQNSPQKPTCDIYNPGSPSGESCVYLSSQQQVNWYFPPSSNNIMGIRYTMTFILNDTNYGTTAQASSSFGVNYPSPTPTFTPTPTKTPTPSCPPGTFVTLTNLPTDRKIEAKPYTLTWSDIPSTTNVKYRIVVTDGPNTLVNHLTQDISQKSYTVDFTGKAGKTYSIEVYGVNACGFGAIGAGGMATVDIVAVTQPFCQVSLSPAGSVQLEVGKQMQLTANVSVSNSFVVSRVSFVNATDGIGMISYDRQIVVSPPYTAVVTGVRPGTVKVHVRAESASLASCSSAETVVSVIPVPTLTITPTKTPTPSCPPGTFVTLTNLPTDRKIEAKPYTLTWSDIPSTTNVKYRIVVTDGPNTLVNHLTQDISQKSYTVDFTGKAGKTYSIEVYGVNACGFGAIGAGGMATVDIVAIAATATPTKTPTLTRTPTPTSTPTPKPCTSDVQCTPPNVCDLVTKKCTIPPNPGPCPKKKEGDADCKNNTAGNPVNLADFEIWRNEYNNDCSKQNLTTVRCFRDEDGDGSLMDANFDYPGSNSGYTDEAVRIPDFEIWRKGYYKYGI